MSPAIVRRGARVSLPSLVRCLASGLALALVVGLAPAVRAAPAVPTAAPPAQDAPSSLAGAPVVRSVRVEGVRRYEPERIVEALGQPTDAPLDPARVRRGIQQLWDGLHVRATVNMRPLPGEPRAVELLVEVVEMPVDFLPRFVGNTSYDDEELLEWAGLAQDTELYLHQAALARNRIEDNYKREGYYFAEVELVQAGNDPAATDLTFEVREGPRVKVRDMVLHGARAMPEKGAWFWKTGLKRLAGVQQGGPSRFLRFKPRFVEEELEADLLAMRQVYRDRGWLDAVVELDRLEFNEQRDRVTIHVVVDEGPRYTVGSLEIETYQVVQNLADPGAPRLEPVEPLFPLEELLEQCELEPGTFFGNHEVRTDARALQDLYGAAGHISDPTLPAVDRWRFLDPELVYDVERAEVHVTYRLAEGRQIYLREIRFSGNLHTRDRVLRRELSVFPGELADLPEIQRSRARIAGTGFFSNPRDPLNHREPIFRFLDTADPSWKDLEYVVEEGNVINFNFSGGVGDSVGAFISTSVSMTNFDATNLPSSPWSALREIGDKEAFHGDGQRLRLFASPGTEESTYGINWRHPDIFARHLNRISLELDLERSLRNYSNYDEVREEAGFTMGRQFGRENWLEWGYRFGTVEVDDIDVGGPPSLTSPLTVPQLLADQEGVSDLSYLELGFRRRAVDNRLNPREGHNLGLTVQVSDTSLGSDYDFVRTNLTGDVYGLFGDPDQNVRHGFKLRLGMGVSVPYGDTQDVPYTERFFLGGGRTLRGFRLRGVGPNEDGDPIGGQTYVNASLEYRIPLRTVTQPGTYEEFEMARGALFVDAGILDPDEFALDFDELRASVGFSIGLTYPIPLIFSFGFPFEDGPGDRKRTFNFEVGF